MHKQRLVTIFIPLFLAVALTIFATACSQETDSGQAETASDLAAASSGADGSSESVSALEAPEVPRFFDASKREPKAEEPVRASATIEVRPASPRDRDGYYEARRRAERS